MTADKAVKAILPFFQELSNEQWWTDLLAAWINFEDKGPPKSVSCLKIVYWYVFSPNIFSDCQLTIILLRFLYGKSMVDEHREIKCL